MGKSAVPHRDSSQCRAGQTSQTEQLAQAESQAGRPKICTRICCALLLSRQKLDQDPICLHPLRNRAVKVKDIIKGSPTLLALNPSFPLNTDLSTPACLLRG